MSGNGWLRINRKIREHWLWKDKPFSKGQAWIDMLLRASWEDKKELVGNTVIEIHPGQFITSEKTLMADWGWSKEKVRKFMMTLESDHMIDRKPDRKQTTVTIVNWGSFQIPQTTNQTTNQTADRPQTDRKQTTNNHNINNIYIKQDNKNEYMDVGGYNYSLLGQPTTAQYDEIQAWWNQIPHALRIDKIIPGTRREDEVRIVIGMYGYDGLKRAIQSVKDSAYLQRRGHVQFDNYINRNVVQKLLEGSYNEDYGTQQSGGNDELTIDWGSAEQDYSPLSAVPE